MVLIEGKLPKYKTMKSNFKVLIICEVLVFLLAIIIDDIMPYFRSANAFSFFDSLKSKLFPNKHNNIGANITTTAVTSSQSSNQCDQTLWKHVYQSSRLHVLNSCIAVSGIIESNRAEADGDTHLRLKLDPQFTKLVNSANIKDQNGDLVLEPICQHLVIQPNAFFACIGSHQNMNIPPIGTHVKVTGSYVLDTWHGKWAEIHPVTTIVTLH
jgi:hypothetical protein